MIKAKFSEGLKYAFDDVINIHQQYSYQHCCKFIFTIKFSKQNF